MALVGKVREDLPKMYRLKVNTLLIVDVHARDIVDAFVRDGVSDAREFAWESQMRVRVCGAASGDVRVPPRARRGRPIPLAGYSAVSSHVPPRTHTHTAS